MDKLIKEWRDAAGRTKAANEEEDSALANASDNAKSPDDLRPAKSRDIYIGSIIWYPDHDHDDGSMHWEFVEQVMYPDDQWKAFSGHSGCRYGLKGAFVSASQDIEELERLKKQSEEYKEKFSERNKALRNI